MPFGFKLKYIRNHKKIDQQKLGAALGYTGKVANTTISQYETGSKRPRDKQVYFKLAKELDCSVQMLESTKLHKQDEMIFSLFWMSLRAGLDIDKDQYGNFILRFNANKTHLGVDEELLDQLNDWYNMAQKERAGAISNDNLTDWMLKYPFGPNTHYEEIFKITGQPCDYESADQFFHKAKIHRYMEYTDEELKEVIRPEDLGLTNKRKK